MAAEPEVDSGDSSPGARRCFRAPGWIISSGSASSKPVVAGKNPAPSAAAMSTSSFTPHAPSVWPMYGLSAQMAGGSPNTRRMPAASLVSFIGLAVPCALMPRISRRSTPACARMVSWSAAMLRPSGCAVVTRYESMLAAPAITRMPRGQGPDAESRTAPTPSPSTIPPRFRSNGLTESASNCSPLNPASVGRLASSTPTTSACSCQPSLIMRDALMTAFAADVQAVLKPKISP